MRKLFGKELCLISDFEHEISGKSQNPYAACGDARS